MRYVTLGAIRSVAVLVLWAGGMGVATAGPVLNPNEDFAIHFDELPPQPVNGLSFMGVTFNFTGGAATFGGTTTSFGHSNLLQFPVLEGPTAGTLTLDFASPAAALQFDVGLTTTERLTPGFTVELFDIASTSLGVTSVNTSPADSSPFAFSEARFSRTTGPLVSQAVIKFPSSGLTFALDNLIGVTVPEPSTLVLAGIGGLTLLGYAWCRRQLATG